MSTPDSGTSSTGQYVTTRATFDPSPAIQHPPQLFTWGPNPQEHAFRAPPFPFAYTQNQQGGGWLSQPQFQGGERQFDLSTPIPVQGVEGINWWPSESTGAIGQSSGPVYTGQQVDPPTRLPEASFPFYYQISHPAEQFSPQSAPGDLGPRQTFISYYPPAYRPRHRRAMTLTGTKRKATSESSSITSTAASNVDEITPTNPRKVARSLSLSAPGLQTTAVSGDASGLGQPPLESSSTSAAGSQQGAKTSETRPHGAGGGEFTAPIVSVAVGDRRSIVEAPESSGTILPAGRVFPIQIGSDLFRLSGASISSDAPSYFSTFFRDQIRNQQKSGDELKTLYIDRDPITFKDISLHLQGYYVTPRNAEHFVRLFADAQFYSLPRLTQQLFKSEIFIRIGEREFQIPRDIFSSPGDSPNYFTLGFAHFFTTPSNSFPGLDNQMLLRPPPIQPPLIASRSGDIFADLIRLLQGYPLNIKDEKHRAELLRDARYFHLKGLEQRLIPHNISYNSSTGETEIVVSLEDIRQSGISIKPARAYATATSDSKGKQATLEPDVAQKHGIISYARPFTGDKPHTLILETSSLEPVRIKFFENGSDPWAATFCGQTLSKMISLFSIIGNKAGSTAAQPAAEDTRPSSISQSGASDSAVKVHFDEETCLELNEEEFVTVPGGEEGQPAGNTRWRRKKARLSEAGTAEDELVASGFDRDGRPENGSDWIVRRAQWRLHVHPAAAFRGGVRVVLHAVMLDAFTSQAERNRNRGFLPTL